MSRQKRQKQSSSQRILWLMSLIIVLSMVISLVIVALPTPPAPTATPVPTWTPAPVPTDLPATRPTEALPEPSPSPSPAVEPTEPVIGPALPTDTATVLPTATALPAFTPTLTITPAPTFTPTPTATLVLTFTLTPGAESEQGFTFAVAGDSRSDPRTYGRVLEAVMADGSEFLLHTGDLVNNGTQAEWQEFRQIMAGFALPFFPVPGNHDGRRGQLDGYLAYTGAPAAHYSFDWGSLHFALADSHNGGIGASELAWLREDLSATAQPIKVVVLHHPPFDPDGSDHIMAYGNDPFTALMAEQQVDYVFAGHIHAFAQQARAGTLYTITGGAGAELHVEDHPQAFHHYLRVTVRGDEVSIEVVKV